MVRGAILAVLAAATLLAPAAAHGYSYDPQDIVVSPDGRNLYATDGITMSYSRDPATGTLTELDDEEPGGALMAISPDGSYVFVARTDRFSEADALYVFSRNPQTGILTLQWQIAEGHYGTISKPTALEVSPDGHQLYVSQTGPKALVTYGIDADTGKLALVQALKRTDLGPLASLAVAPDGRSVYAANTQDGTKLWSFARDADTGALTPGASYATLRGPLAISPDGTRVYDGRLGYDVWQRDPSTGALTFLQQTSFPQIIYDQFDFYDVVLGVGPDGTVFSGNDAFDRAHAVIRQAKVTPDGVELERGYHEPGDIFGAILPRRMRWSPNGQFAYLASAGFGPGGRRQGVSVLRWDAALRELTQEQFVSSLPTGGPPGGAPSVTIDDGALYTNDPEVSLSITPPRAAASFRIAGDLAGLDEGPARRFERDGIYRWRLDTTGAAPRDVRHAYVRIWTGGDPITISDDIVLDQTAPTVTSARIKDESLKVAAHDDRSGVRRMQVTRNRAKPGKRRRFSKHVALPDGAGKLYVRVFDGAHNRSHWRTAHH